MFKICKLALADTAWKVSKCGVISGPYFPVFGPEITPYLDTFHAVWLKEILIFEDQWFLRETFLFKTLNLVVHNSVVFFSSIFRKETLKLLRLPTCVIAVLFIEWFNMVYKKSIAVEPCGKSWELLTNTFSPDVY